ncbi:calcineurin-like phosphoesterase C-terminal domain-containing protein [Bacteroides sp. 1001136B_160425_E2]|uniref:calcineurin-like phosphoesterase C-terminal domain-containing protein n=1 Tax=Bacteroides sp. 1001136B_160425_E2 TaxID=2787083 RepID=UPI00189D6E43|nr:calcineurin-like phosphoesterase family protein [Bacteroides sp. 1001136B_160425_E2]
MKIYLLQFFLLIGLGLNLQAQIPSNPIRGKVTCNGIGIPGIVVTDGIDCMLTDQQGQYTLPPNRDVRFIYLSTPSGYLPKTEQTLPVFYQKLDPAKQGVYDFELVRNLQNEINHLFLVQADAQVTSEDDVKAYAKYLQDMKEYIRPYTGKKEVFGIDCGDIVGDTPSLYPSYINTVSSLEIPIYRTIGNHDMTYGGRTFEYSYRTFESYFGPIYYSFNKGNAHYIVLDNCFYVNRDYQYIGYIDERTFQWLEKDLSYVPKDKLVFVVMHIPSSLEKKLRYNTLDQDETVNTAALYELLEGYNAHIISGHTHFNVNVCFNDSLMEHNTAAVCGTWWRADINVDGTPRGYGVYEVDGNQVKWIYKSAGYPKEYQLHVYPAGSSDEHPSDIIANVWNWDEQWKVEWYENGKRMGEMQRYKGYDPAAKAICSDKEQVKYEWISPVLTEHLFHATPRNKNAKMEVKVTDRFGNVYTKVIENK